MSAKNFIILPGSSDANRGDQALVWETVEMANKSGYIGQFYMTSTKENSQQSNFRGIKSLKPILEHPSRRCKNKENIDYNAKLIFKWGTVAVLDFFSSIVLLNKITRIIFSRFYCAEKRYTLEMFKSSDAFFVKGGGFLHSYGRKTDFYLMYYNLFHIKLALKFKKPVFIMPNSFGPFKGLGVKRIISGTLSKCKIITARESISKKMMSDIGIDCDLIPDLGFNLKRNNRYVADINTIINKHKNRKLVAITARPYRFDESNDPKLSFSKYIKSMVSMARWLYSNGYMPVFVEHVLSETKHESDAYALKEIISQLVDGQHEYISNSKYNCEDLKQIYSECDYTIGTRFHSVIFSLSEGVPSIAITYGGNKGQGIMKDMNLEEYAIDINFIEPEILIEKFCELVNNQEQVKEKIRVYLEALDSEYCRLLCKLEEASK